ncbi:uncharacterized protein LOC114249784 [Bombyx mandarina]|uniref:Uncharacterized protein LOC114249784 n=1 Tax=Bombyx mandarina TaxID=7092 RepID=A0A6J2KBH5_BOMMA|nr:uncharacterized protein LOC114249784 [Bombyx mandarina]
MAKDMLALKFIVLNILIMVCVGVKQECSPFRPDYSSYQEFQYCSTAYYLSLSLRFTNIPVGATSYRLLTARHDLLHLELVGEGNISANENCFDESVHILPKRYNLSLELYLNYKGDALCKAVKILDLYNNEADCSNTVYYNIGLIRFNLENSCELRQQTTENSGPSAPLPTAVRTSTTRSVTSHPMTSWSSTDATVSTTRRKTVLTSPSTPAINSTDRGFGSPISPAAPAATTVSTVTVSATSPTPETLSFKDLFFTPQGYSVVAVICIIVLALIVALIYWYTKRSSRQNYQKVAYKSSRADLPRVVYAELDIPERSDDVQYCNFTPEYRTVYYSRIIGVYMNKE